MAVRATFTGFESYKLTGVTMTDQELGHGSYATVLQLDYMGLKCAGKKIHELLMKQGDSTYTVRRFEEECRLLSQVRHPNIVQFLGVHFQEGVTAPILVMEFLPTNLTSCIEQYGILPKEISYSILHDVALGLCYLHSQTPPIIHRDLSSNNVLLTANMTAKISDLGVARILNLTPLQVSRMTQAPGTPAYMPPEVMIANPKYDASVDQFSYGIMMIHMFSGRWPEPQVGPIHTEPGKMIPVSEAERREVFLKDIGNDHPLMDLILKCIDNHPQTRANATKIAARLAEMAAKCPASFSNRLEMLKCIKRKEEDIQTLKIAADSEIRKNQKQIEQISQAQQRYSNEIERQNLEHSIENAQLQVKVKDLKSQNERLRAESESKVKELKSKAAVYEVQLENKAKQIQEEREQYRLQLANEKTDFDKQTRQYKKQLATAREQLDKEREENEKLTGIVQEFKFELSRSKREVIRLQDDMTMSKGDVEKRDISLTAKDDEIEAKVRVIQQKDSTISELSEQLSKVKTYLSTKQQSVQASINWKQCADLPTKLSSGKCTVIDGKVYCGGGMTANDDENKYIVFCYDPVGDKWTTLPPLPVRYFGLGQVGGKLVAVGGMRKDRKRSNEVFTFDERSKKWKQTISAMPTPRHAPSTLSLQSPDTLLIVAGGGGTSGQDTDAVEVYKAGTSQWYSTDPLPTACQDISLHFDQETMCCYALGGFKYPSQLNQALYASISDLLGNAVLSANQTGAVDSRENITSESAWKTLPNTKTYQPSAAVFAGNLLAIGGQETLQGGKVKKNIYMYSPSTESWVYFGNLPEPRSQDCVQGKTNSRNLVST